MLSVVTFLESLVNKNEDGRILVTKNPELSKSHIKYILLNPANHFTDIVQDARSIIVAGGTMEPVSEFKDQLFGSLGVPESRIHHFSCGHVIPKENILPLILCSGPTNRKFDLTFENRTKGDTLKEIAMTITNLCTIVPKGMVCFFPSYDYEAIVYNYMRDNHFIERIARIAKKKVVFREPKKTSEVDKVLSDYGTSVEKGGALMLSVIGGKLSEGLNFSDDLGRCVVVVGILPLDRTSAKRFTDVQFKPVTGAQLKPRLLQVQVHAQFKPFAGEHTLKLDYCRYAIDRYGCAIETLCWSTLRNAILLLWVRN
ncbi:ATP-dependent DNA helicase DDX11-like [Diaphorina citri]|uniref:ATP-dependent DNA helicase DDX11-like n=1 Tax=Diaphorina citri TaxID=121845 RepID=A0A1S3D5Y0_DIACI|nr:ATP-dependent DNA helicase DDX11-like [Diaphorina citri]